MNTIIENDRRVYRQVQEFPAGSYVWNIGRHNFQYERCIPICRPLNGNRYAVDTENLAYIEVESEELAQIILKAAGRNFVDRKRYEMIVEQYKTQKR